MDSKAFKIAMLHVSQNEGVSPEKDTPITEDTKSERFTLDQKKKIINDSLDSYYSPVINAYLRKYDDVAQLIVAAHYVVSQFGDSDVPVEEFTKRLGNIKVKILNAVGDTAQDERYSLKETFLNDPKLNNMSEEDIDTYIRSELGQIKRNTITKVKKVEGFLAS